MGEDLAAFVKPNETLLQLLTRTSTEPVPTGVSFIGALRPGHILEAAGPSGCGKTSVLLHVAATAILPKDEQGSLIGGLQENVVLIDLDNKFDILRLIQMLNVRIRSALQSLHRHTDGAALEAAVDASMHECLQRFTLIRCGSSYELLAVLKTVRPLLLEMQNGQGIRLLLLDNIAAFYWVDAAVKAAVAGPGQASSALTLRAVHSVAAAELRSLAKQLKLAVVVTKHSFKSVASAGRVEEDVLWQEREFMMKPWLDAVSQRIVLRHLGGGVGELASQFAAKWQTPPHHHVHTFSISAGGIDANAAW